MSVPLQLTPEEQRKRLENRGIDFCQQTKERDAQKIQEIGYYKLKEFAYPYYHKNADGIREYTGLSFKGLLVRYYQDKNFRINMLHAIEDVEVRMNSVFAYHLGEKYGAFGYLEFKNWVDREIPKFEVEEQQYFFKKNLRKKVKKSNLPDLHFEINLDDEGFPSIWTMVDALTFGDILYLIKIMSPNNIRAIANLFGCSPSQFISWMGCMNFIRNACAHNSDLIDLRLKTKPIVPPSEFAESIHKASGGYSNAIALPVFILKYLMNQVNPMYKFGRIYESLEKLINGNDNAAHSLGFSSSHEIQLLTKRNHKS